ncbi:transposase, YhgA-like family protein [Orientia tsutsugamushi str. Gilliam]|uniref:Transposase, YhgA-like family protein n=1 Tax=Orientia tsutsugamushi str. Gilliam TaxID=1359184 RepID=A0A0F3M723_ORITS|nr:transposase, YhgA-like family protein [Orientia tsutsugamushi str. Gilliam]
MGLFTDSMIAKQLMTSTIQLVDLQSMSNDEIVRKKAYRMLEYMLKHIHQRDMLKLWGRVSNKVQTCFNT